MRLALAIVATLAVACSAFDSTVYGMDVSEPVSETQFKCLKADNLTCALQSAARALSLPAAVWHSVIIVHMYVCMRYLKRRGQSSRFGCVGNVGLMPLRSPCIAQGLPNLYS